MLVVRFRFKGRTVEVVRDDVTGRHSAFLNEIPWKVGAAPDEVILELARLCRDDGTELETE